MNINDNYRLNASNQSKWHLGPDGCKYRFSIKPDNRLGVEWEGHKPNLKAKSFWKKYARKRDAFLIGARPAGERMLVACFFTGKVKTLIGKGLPK